MALQRIRRELRTIREDRPGVRFEATHERHRIRNHAVRVTVIGLGCSLMVLAAATFWVPGPNFVIVLAGLALVAGQWRMVARLMDRGEVAARRWHLERWEPMPRWRQRIVLFVLWAAGGIFAMSMAYVSWRSGALPTWGPIPDRS
jgi:hypothetical protein